MDFWWKSGAEAGGVAGVRHELSTRNEIGSPGKPCTLLSAEKVCSCAAEAWQLRQ